MAKKFNPLTPPFDYYEASTSTAPGGSDTQVQFNDGSSFGGDAGLTFDKTNKQFILTKDGIGVTQSDSYGHRLRNTTAAESGAPQYSPPLIFEGEGYRTGAGAGVKQTEWMIYNKTSSAAKNDNFSWLQFESSFAGTSYAPIARLWHSPEGSGVGKQGFDIIGPSGSVLDVGASHYLFTLQNNSSSVDFQLINENFAVEGSGFFVGAGTTFEIYATEGGGVIMYPDTSESLAAFFLDAEGNLTLKTSSVSAQAVLTLNQQDIDDTFFNFVGTSASDASRSISTRTVATVKGFVRVDVNGTEGWMAIYNAPTS